MEECGGRDQETNTRTPYMYHPQSKGSGNKVRSSRGSKEKVMAELVMGTFTPGMSSSVGRVKGEYLQGSSSGEDRWMILGIK